MEESSKKIYLKCKYRVKKWEGQFKDENGRNPSKNDIKNAPSKIKEAYKTYWKLKTICLETSLVDVTFGDEDTMDAFSFLSQEVSSIAGQVSKSNSEAIEEDNSILPFDISQQGESKAIEPKEDIKELSPIATEVTNQNHDSETKQDKSVWGSHLSNLKKPSGEKPKQEKSAILSRYTAKLFAGATFRKRNPRKSFIRKEKSMNSLLQPENSLTTDSNQSFSLSESNFSSEVDSSVVKEDSVSAVDDDSTCLGLENSCFKIVKSTQSQQQFQPVSLLQKNVKEDLSISKNTLGPRCIDKGWLDRLEKVTSVETKSQVNTSDSGIELTDSSVEQKSSPQNTPDVQAGFSDEDDFVCDSDDESERTSISFSSLNSSIASRSFSRLPTAPSSLNTVTSQSFGKLPTMPSTNNSFKRASSSLSCINQTAEVASSAKRPMTIDKSEGIESVSKKAKLDFGVLSENLNSSSSRLPVNIRPLTDLDSNFKLSIEELESKPIKSKVNAKEEGLRKKLISGTANENFVKINIKKKTYVRGKKTMTFQKYKKQKWKDLKKNQNTDVRGILKCFKCGDVGHFAKNCMKACDQLLPIEDMEEEDDSPFPSLLEAEEMAQEVSKTLCVRRKLNDLPVHVASEQSDLSKEPPPQPIATDDLMRLVNHEPVFKPKEDGSVIDTPLSVLDALMQFGFQSFRPGQEQAVMRVLSGQSTLVTLSTGSGKSLCYQLPAYLYHTLQKRITIVVSPLVSLMEDQVFGVSPCLKIACLHTYQPPKVREAVYEQLRANSLHALLVSPESLAIGDRVSELLRSLPPVAFACIDEAHCISQWSHNFRPSYLMICQVLREKFGVKTFLGLTATATLPTITSVSKSLGLPDGVGGVIRDTPLPDNLQLSVSRDRDKDQALIALLHGARFSDCRSIIVYCTRRDECMRLAAYIRTCMQDVSREDGVNKRGKVSWNAEAYHAGLTGARRKAVQKAFMSGKTRIVVATVAFGMGINKQDIQGIIHYNMPSAFERYVQEVGRAGRDGNHAHCHLFLNTQGEDLSELRRHIYADSVERHTIRKLLQRVFVDCTCGEACPSHEVAFSVNDTVAALDLPEENIATLLCYLELHARQWAHVCSPAYTQCRILSYKGPKPLRQAAKECPPLAVAVAMELQKGAKLEKVTKLEFPIFPVATAIKWDSGIVKKQLKNLEWTKVNDQPRRSGLTVEFYELGFRVQAPGNLSATQLDLALDSLTQRVEDQETTALRQLEAIFHTLHQVSHASVEQCLDKVDGERCEKLKTEIREYFTKEDYLGRHSLPEVTLNNEEQVTSDTRSLINCYRDETFTARAVARIFHGIASPNYPAQRWGRCRFWRAHLHEDFKLICRLATRELIKMR